MKTSVKGLVELVGHEGICLNKYKDSVGVWTTGIGATRTEIPDLASWPLDKRITIQEAFDLLTSSIKKYEFALNKYLTNEIPQHQFDALVSWVYNVGTGYAKTATVVKLANQHASNEQLYNAIMMYRKPKEILGRRRKEAALLTGGVYSNGGRALLFPVSSKGYPMYGKGKSINVWEYISHSSDHDVDVPHVELTEERVAETRPSLVSCVLKTFNDMFKGEEV